ncbi:unnamed protein product [Brassica rapa subsp. narinosa]|uniref:(rape) hypothetical protein n=1 Tax=Brassica napus TaxID=3708 RepID=A0A816XH36_BRANA|nr:unnamed protein product [Brassica napus]
MIFGQFKVFAPSKHLFSVGLVRHIKQRIETASGWIGASYPATNWLWEYQQPSASAVRPFVSPLLPLLDLCVISRNNQSLVVSRDSPPLLCHHSIHQFSLLASLSP